MARQYKRPASDEENEPVSDGDGSNATFASLASKPTFKMPELMHNVNKIVSSLEQNIIKADQT